LARQHGQVLTEAALEVAATSADFLVAVLAQRQLSTAAVHALAVEVSVD